VDGWQDIETMTFISTREVLRTQDSAEARIMARGGSGQAREQLCDF